MSLYARVPAAPLASFVDLVWFCDEPRRPFAKERRLPDGASALIINLGQDETRIYDPYTHELAERFNGAVLVGTRSDFTVIDTHEAFYVVGVQFKPAGLPPFFGVPAGELRGLHVPLDDLWRGEGARLRERLLEAPTADAKLDVIERALLARAGWRRSQRWCEPRPAVGYALAALDGCPDRLTIADISHRVGLSPRRFIQIFDDAVGLTPKLFARLRRFQRVLAATGMRPVDWAGLSAACGYFDQAHLIRDFHAFCGLTPRQYLARRTGHWNHVNVGE